MWTNNTYCLRRGRPWILLAVALNLGFAGWAWGQTPAAVVRIEADWELVLGAPDTGNDSPQIVCVLSPTNNVGGIYSVFELNQQSLPFFSPGGLQLQLWEGENLLSECKQSSGYLLQHEGETVTWTQAMELRNGRLWFEVLHGQSTTWGVFGDAEGALSVSVPSSRENLDTFDLEVSLKNSGVGFGGNRVQSMILKRLRFTNASGETWEQNVNQSVRQFQ
ncbi:MAG: hypothetical protein JXB10_11940 [Pirellulales bacterium]|nr:hypothetical protein [Pirellulales bacterium]